MKINGQVYAALEGTPYEVQQCGDHKIEIYVLDDYLDFNVLNDDLLFQETNVNNSNDIDKELDKVRSGNLDFIDFSKKMQDIIFMYSRGVYIMQNKVLLPIVTCLFVLLFTVSRA